MGKTDPLLPDEKLSRRSLLKNLGAIGLVPMASGADVPSESTAHAQESVAASPRPSRNVRNENPALHRLSAGRMTVDFEKDLGTVHAIAASGDPLGTNFLGNQLNTRGVALGDPHWTGDIVATVWRVPETARPGQAPAARRPGRWQSETTLGSDDIRRITFDAERFQVRYEGGSKNAAGIRSFTLGMSYRLAGDRSLLWDIEIENITGHLLEIGELAIPLRANDDYGIYYRGAPLPDTAALGRTTAIQKAIHEQKVLAHAFVAERIDIEAATGEIARAAYSGQTARLTLDMDDSTGLVTTVNLAVKGLPPGAYEVRHGNASTRHDVKDTLTLALPVAQAKNIIIQRTRPTGP